MLNFIKRLFGFRPKTPEQIRGNFIYFDATCPACQAKDELYVMAEGGLAQNIECRICATLFWAWRAEDYAEAKIIRDAEGNYVSTD